MSFNECKFLFAIADSCTAKIKYTFNDNMEIFIELNSDPLK
jgi:hypothetical protein